VMTVQVFSTTELEATLARLSREPNIGLIFTGAFLSLHAKLIVETVARYRLPAIYGTQATSSWPKAALCTTLTIPRNRSGSHRSMLIASSRATKRAICVRRAD
jgi:hypothetical protein